MRRSMMIGVVSLDPKETNAFSIPSSAAMSRARPINDARAMVCDSITRMAAIAAASFAAASRPSMGS